MTTITLTDTAAMLMDSIHPGIIVGKFYDPDTKVFDYQAHESARHMLSSGEQIIVKLALDAFKGAGIFWDIGRVSSQHQSAIIGSLVTYCDPRATRTIAQSDAAYRLMEIEDHTRSDDVEEP